MIEKSIKSISALLMVSTFLVMAMPVLAQNESTPTPTATPASTTAPSQKLIDGLACMKTAADKREAALGVAWDTVSSSVKSAYSARRSALAEAWGITVKKERNTKFIKAWRDFGVSTRAARKTFNTDRQKAWKAYNTERAACKTKYGASNTTAQDYGTIGSDMSL